MDSEERSLDAASINPSDPSPADSDLDENFPSSDPFEASNGDPAAEMEGFIAVNQNLVEEVACLRDVVSEKEQTTGILQKELNENLERVEALNADILSLEVENREDADSAAGLAKEVQALHSEKIILLDENAKVALEKQSLDATHAELQEKLSIMMSDLEGKKAVMAAAQAQVLMTCFEIEKLQLEKEEYSKEISKLHASNGAMTAQVVQLTEEEKALSIELENVISAKALAEQKVGDLQAAITTLGVQLSTLHENDKQSSVQLLEAKARIHYLEDLNNAMALRETDILAHIKDLESQLHTLKANFETTYQALDQEEARADGQRRLEVACLKVGANESDLCTLRSSSEMPEEDADARRQQHVQDLESRVAVLCAETEGLERSNEDLRAVLTQQQENELVVSTQLREDIKKLEVFLNEAEERAQALQGEEVELKLKLQGLTASTTKKQRLGGFTTPLVISGGTIVVVGLLVLFLHTKSKSK